MAELNKTLSELVDGIDNGFDLTPKNIEKLMAGKPIEEVIEQVLLLERKVSEKRMMALLRSFRDNPHKPKRRNKANNVPKRRAKNNAAKKARKKNRK